MTPKPLILHFLAVTRPGGSELGALEFARRQTESRHQALFLLPRGPVNDLFEEAGFTTRCLDLGPRGWPAVRRELGRELAAAQPAIVHAYGLRPSLLVRLRRRRPHHLVEAYHMVEDHRPTWQAWLDRLTARQVDLYVTNSRAGARFLQTRRGVASERLAVVANGIPLAPYLAAAERRAAARRALGLADDEPVIVTVANFVPPKGHEVLVAAAAALRARGRRFTWLVAGSGAEEKRVRALIERAGLADAVRLLGYCRDVVEPLAAADLFCLTSHSEGVPVAVVEAMASGLAVVATEVGAIRELVADGEHGHLVPAADPGAVSRVIEALLDDDDRRRAFGRAGQAHARSHHGIERAAEEMGALYRQLLDLPRRAASTSCGSMSATPGAR